MLTCKTGSSATGGSSSFGICGNGTGDAFCESGSGPPTLSLTGCWSGGSPASTAHACVDGSTDDCDQIPVNECDAGVVYNSFGACQGGGSA